jgi:CHAD domain-containing protein
VVALAAVETAVPVDRADQPGSERRILRLEAVVDDDAWKTVAATLESALERAPDELHDWAAIRGRTPGDYRTAPRLENEPRMPAETALRSILAQLAEIAANNVPGVLADHDIEFLHDLRVAGRRARSALSQLREVLECPDLEDHLRWLGRVTGSCRDLDVWLVDIPAMRAMLPARHAADLDPLAAHLQTARDHACREVRRALRSPRFAALMRTWHRVANDPIAGPRAAEPIASVAADRIGRRYRRIVTRGAGLGADPPAASLHRIRIDAKKLRYLLEFFEPVLNTEGIGSVIKEVKRLQDLLGSFNDLEIQQRRLLAIADELKADPSVPAATLFALGRLQGVLEERQDEERLKFHDRFEVFASASVARTVDHLLELEDGQ